MLKINKDDIHQNIEKISQSQLELIDQIVRQFIKKGNFYRNPNSDIVSEDWLQHFANLLFIHHATSYAPFAKEKFEYGFIYASKKCGMSAEKTKNRTFKGCDLSLNNVPISLKTQADENIKFDTIFISKFMELGKGVWEFGALRQKYFDHMKSYDRIFTLRTLVHNQDNVDYELVEIPKKLLLEADGKPFDECVDSRQNPKPGYCHVRDKKNKIKFSLYFDGGTERKLQIKNIDKSNCIIHATWKIELIK